MDSVLIRNAELNGLRVSVRIADGKVAAIGQGLPDAGGPLFDAQGGALLPGLHDHHLHLHALAARRNSVRCGPPDVSNADTLSLRLVELDRHSAGWLRGVDYHESVAGDIDRDWLDERLPRRPARIQHRGGRLWVFNSAALAQLDPGPTDPLERKNGRLTGRLYDGDAWLRERMGATRPSLADVSRELAGYGITGVTDTTPQNGPGDLQAFASAQANNELLQDLRVMGGDALHGADASASQRVQPAARKFHLLESALPDFEACCRAVRRAHAANRNVAFHCVTRTELVFVLGVLRGTGTRLGDRIEHASVTPLVLLPRFHELGLAVVTQPGLVHSRGDRYLTDVDAEDRGDLYRLRAFLDAGIRLAGSSDAPFGEPNPWVAMQAAVDRRTREGRELGGAEALAPDEALALYTSPLSRPGTAAPGIRSGMPADLCVLDRGWARARASLADVRVRLTLRAGECIHRATRTSAPTERMA